MKKKSGVIILIISFLIMAAEVMAFMIFIKPGMKLKDFYEAAEKGDYTEMDRIYSGLSSDEKEDALDIMNDMSVHYTNEYLKDNISYDEFSRVLQGILEMDSSVRGDDLDGLGKFSSNWIKCYIYANKKELPIRFKRCVDELVSQNKDDYYLDNKITFKSVYNLTYRGEGVPEGTKRPLSKEYTDAIDQSLTDWINQLYEDYLNGKIDDERINACLKAASEVFPEDSQNAAAAIESEHSVKGSFEDVYDECKKQIDEGAYVEAIQKIDAYVENNKSTKLFKDYQTKFEELRASAVETGKGFYPVEIQRLIKQGELEEAEDLLEKVYMVFENEVDLHEQKAFLNSYWKKAYYIYMQNWEENLKKDVASGVRCGYNSNSADVDYAANKPDLMCFKDLDGGGVPELILYNKRSGYTYILTCLEGRVIFAGCLKILGYGNDSSMIIAEPYGSNVSGMEVKADLCQFSQNDACFYVAKYVYRNRDYTYFNINGTEYTISSLDNPEPQEPSSEQKTENIDGEEFSVIISNFDKAYNEIKSYTDTWGSDPRDAETVMISRFFEYIYSYK
ncbi:hypothetical protein SAMN04487934_10969 [Eubacterium ruminantium]|nr:hypothetical protein SAMN04487934_10969 [Eubacterium ruminantium]